MQQEKLDQAQLREMTQKYVVDSYQLLKEFLSVPNDSHFPEQVEQNVKWVKAAFQKRKFTTTILETGGPPLVLAERKADNSVRTLLVYLQIDGQPVEPSQWSQEHPFKPVLKEKRAEGWEEIPWNRLQGKVDPDWRMFGRSTSDAKGPVIMFLTALDILDAEGLKQEYNIKVIMDLEEEVGSPHLPKAVAKHKQALVSDMLIVCDGPRHVVNKPTLIFGARGIATATLTVFGPKAPQHSGHYGNYAPNPALRLVQLLASMKDETGRVTIPGYYEGIELDQKTLAILAQVPDDEEAIQRKMGIGGADQVGRNLQESLQYPSLNIRGLTSGWTGDKARTIIPSSATAEIDIRLVPESNGEHLIQLVRKHIESQGYYLISGEEPTDQERRENSKLAAITHQRLYAAFQTPYESKVGNWLFKALVRAFDAEPIRIRTSGGSVPISPFVETLGVPSVIVPTVNHDNNQHGPDENLRLGNYLEGITTFLSILTEPFD